MSARDYQHLLKEVGWSLTKGGTDYSLRDEKGNFVCTIKITHGKNTKKGEIPVHCIRKTERIFEEKGLLWPPKKK